MELQYYQFRYLPGFDMYVFEIDGRNGKIQKAVIFQEVYANSFNLFFGDWNGINRLLDDGARTGNREMQKILMTIAQIVALFFSEHPNAVVFATGNTASRTRLYQIMIKKYLQIIDQSFEVEGFCNFNWTPIESDKQYDGFLVRRKTNF